MIFVLIVVLVILAVIFILSRKKYDEFIEPLDKKKYPFKQFIPIALYIMDLVKYSYNTKYDRKLSFKLAELYGLKYSQYYLRIHYANKIIYVLLSILFVSFIASASKPDFGILIFGIALIIGVIYASDNELEKQVRSRRTSIQIDFPEFLNKLMLLVNAGLTVPRAWEKIVTENRKVSPLYDELDVALSDVRAGKPETKAYEDFAKRCRTPEVTKFVSIILQNLKKGNSELVSILRVQSNECWEMRKNAAKRIGEEASTRLLLPMMIMFIAILAIVATPAILALQGI